MYHQLHHQIDKLKTMILEIGVVVERSLEMAVNALTTDDVKIAKDVINSDQRIDQMEVLLEEECLDMLALYQPVANDLRYIIAVLKINNDLERIGDLAVSIAERALIVHDCKEVSVPKLFDTMSRSVRKMLQKSINSLVNANPEAALHVCAMDDEVDEYYKKAAGEMEKAIIENPEYVKCYISFLNIFRSLERIADHITNISEDVIYMVEGKINRHRIDV